MDWILFPIIGLLAGWIAGFITKGSGFGLIRNLIVGVLGAMLGGLLLKICGFEVVALRGKLISATIGAVALLTLLKWRKKLRRPPQRK